MQPAAAGDTSGMVVNKKGARSAEGTYVNSEAFWRKKIADVPVDQVSFLPFVRAQANYVAVLPQVLLHQAGSEGRCCRKEEIRKRKRGRGHATR